MWNLILILIIGGIIGWIASKIMGTDAEQGVLLNIVVGIVGAFIGGLLFSGGLLSGEINLVSLVVALLGAIILLFIVRLVRR